MSELTREQYPLKRRKFLITGVSRRSGIGYAIARKAAALGASVIIHHHQAHDQEQEWGADDLEAVIEGIKAELVEDATFHEFKGNFMDVSAPEELFKEINKHCGYIDGLVCNHALSGSDGFLEELTAEMIDKHYIINTRSSLLLTQSFMKQHSPDKTMGKVIFMTSGQQQGPMPGEVAYASSKGGLAEIVLTLSDELADKNITINAVNPGPVDTGYLTENTWKEIRSKFPFNRFGTPNDTANLIGWLLTDEASWITGQVINSEGGFARWRS
ncbi:SDR family oxidoreductase [Oceanobacillus sp. CFH 90083]|uniref:SDR family oxidoreductase n=1 Tax=Oceanobacillus sp. CFH 90083 TaxID=2592336 RepID=UPI00128DB21E|nr:SDR family oxidoreductase [Oceanobacillus sp. CFH 90083]